MVNYKNRAYGARAIKLLGKFQVKMEMDHLGVKVVCYAIKQRDDLLFRKVAILKVERNYPLIKDEYSAIFRDGNVFESNKEAGW